MLDPEHLVVDGKAAPMTVITVIKPYQAWLTRLIMTFFRITGIALDDVSRLRFIHFAQWTVIKPGKFDSQYNGQSIQPVKRNHYLFTTNFNGPWDQYIDSFALVKRIRSGIDWFWRTSQKFTKAYPIRRFKRYIRYHEHPVDAYYNAYPGASIRDIESALEAQFLARELEDSYRVTHGLPGIEIPSWLTVSFILVGSEEEAPPLHPSGSQQAALNKFKNEVTVHLSSTRAHRAPTRKGANGPHGLQL